MPENANENCPGVESEEAGKAKSCEGCPMQERCSSGQTAQEAKLEPDPSMNNVARMAEKYV